MAKLTLKQRRLIKGIAGGMTQRAAANAAGISEEYASRVVKKGQVLEALGELMERSGLGDLSLLAKHAELLEATKVIAVVTGKDAGMGTVDFIVGRIIRCGRGPSTSPFRLNIILEETGGASRSHPSPG